MVPRLDRARLVSDVPGLVVRCGGALVRRVSRDVVRVVWTRPALGYVDVEAPAGRGSTLAEVIDRAR